MDVGLCACWPDYWWMMYGPNQPGQTPTELRLSYGLPLAPRLPQVPNQAAACCIYSWVLISAFGADDRDLIQGPGDWCLTNTCSGDPISCWPGYSQGHQEANQDEKYEWTVTNAKAVYEPSNDEEMSDPSCPAFNYDKDSFIWVQMPEAPGQLVTITCQRDECPLYAEGGAQSYTGYLISEDQRNVVERHFWQIQQLDLSGTQVEAKVNDANARLNDDLDGPWRRYDSDHDNVLDAERGGYDTPVCTKYDMASFATLPDSHPTALKDQLLALVDEDGQVIEVIEVSEWAVVGGVDNWWTGLNESVVLVEPNELYNIVDKDPKPPHGHRVGGLGICGQPNVVMVADASGCTLLHEWGHNVGLAHTWTGSEELWYVANVMRPVWDPGVKRYISRTPLYVDTKPSCGKSFPQKESQYAAFENET